MYTGITQKARNKKETLRGTEIEMRNLVYKSLEVKTEEGKEMNTEEK